MEHRTCFGSIQEITRPDGLITTSARPECRTCQEMLECLRHARKRAEAKHEKDEIEKQERIARILDLSQIVSNEVGSCLLQFLNRIYHSSLGSVLFKNLLLFFELTDKSPSFSLTVPLSRSIFRPVSDDEDPEETGSHLAGGRSDPPTPRGLTLRIIFIQTSFPGNYQATMGLIAREVVRTLSSDRDGLEQISKVLPGAEARRLETMFSEARVNWLMEKWGFEEEAKALEKALTG